MLLLRTVAPGLLLLAVLGQQVSLASGKNATGRGQSAGDEPLATRGKFSVKDKMQCTWGAREAGDWVKLTVKCRNPEARASSRMCQYMARPQRCEGYLSDKRGFWKQVARALNRLQDRVCTDERALVKAGMCRRAPRGAHFKLDAGRPETSDRVSASRTPPRATSAAPTACTGRADHRTAAEEYCGSAWASVCSFVFSVLQSDC